jgi:hypothetical protein
MIAVEKRETRQVGANENNFNFLLENMSIVLKKKQTRYNELELEKSRE